MLLLFISEYELGCDRLLLLLFLCVFSKDTDVDLVEGSMFLFSFFGVVLADSGSIRVFTILGLLIICLGSFLCAEFL